VRVVAQRVGADQAQYIYDDLGRLSQVFDGQGNVATYQYDAVGNLLSITRNTGGVEAPTITAFRPNIGNAGASVNVFLTDTSLTGEVQGVVLLHALIQRWSRGLSMLPSEWARGDKREKSINRHDSNIVGAKVPSDRTIAFEIIVARHDVRSPTVNGGLEDHVVIRVAAHANTTGDRNQAGA
jgi:YD repeat-containing protein